MRGRGTVSYRHCVSRVGSRTYARVMIVAVRGVGSGREMGGV